MVTSGSVSVTVVEAGKTFNLSANITVKARTNFAFTAVSPTKEPNGYNDPGCGVLQVPNPPVQNGEAGLSCPRLEISFVPGAVQDSGPNQGYKYVVSVSPSLLNGTPTAFTWVIAQDVENTNSAFYLHQCGNYDATTNPNGFISGANLKANTIRHESGSVQSHYENYVVAQNKPSNNPGVVGEAITAPPSTDAKTFADNVTTTLTAKKDAITSAAAMEPCGVSDVRLDANCKFQGFVNFLPYQACQ